MTWRHVSVGAGGRVDSRTASIKAAVHHSEEYLHDCLGPSTPFRDNPLEITHTHNMSRSGQAAKRLFSSIARHAEGAVAGTRSSGQGLLARTTIVNLTGSAGSSVSVGGQLCQRR